MNLYCHENNVNDVLQPQNSAFILVVETSLLCTARLSKWDHQEQKLLNEDPIFIQMYFQPVLIR